MNDEDVREVEGEGRGRPDEPESEIELVMVSSCSHVSCRDVRRDGWVKARRS